MMDTYTENFILPLEGTDFLEKVGVYKSAHIRREPIKRSLCN